MNKAIHTVMLASLLCACSDTGVSVGQQSLELHQRLLTIDSHIDVPDSMGEAGADPREPEPLQVDLPGMEEGGLDAGFFIVFVPQGALTAEGYGEAYRKALRKFSAIDRMLANSPDRIVLATSPDELVQARADAQLVAMIGLENAYPLGADLEHLEEFHQRGLSYVSLTHQGNNDFGGSSQLAGDIFGSSQGDDDGLTGRGAELVKALNQRGIMIDVSHAGPRTTLDIVRASGAPVIASHSSARAIYDHPRNLSDVEIEAIARNGGVIQVVAFERYLRDVPAVESLLKLGVIFKNGLTPSQMGDVTPAEMKRIRDDSARLHSVFTRASVATLIDHVDHIAGLVGIDHVGIASDFGGGGGVHGWDDAGQSAAITDELLRRGYTESEIEKIWGANLLRVWREVARRGTVPRSAHSTL